MLSTSAYSRGVCVCGLPCEAGRPSHEDLKKHNFLLLGASWPSHFLKSNTDLRWRKHLTNWDIHHISLATDHRESLDLVCGQKVSLRRCLDPPQCRSVLRSFQIKLEHRSRVSDKKVRFNLHVCWIFDEPDSWTWSRKMWLVLENRFNILSGKDVRFLCMGQILRGKLSCWSLTS